MVLNSCVDADVFSRTKKELALVNGQMNAKNMNFQ